MVDLHSHSTASDGSCTPERLVELGLGLGLSALALTDHDTLDGIERARAAAAGTPMRLIPGVEVEIARARGEFHLLGLLLEGDTARLREALERVQEARRGRNARMVAKLQEGGYPVTMEELQQLAGGKIISRAHFARLLVMKKITSSTDKAFKRFLGKGAPFYEARSCLDLREATSLIKAAGGVAVIAHPLSLGIHGPALRTFIADCRDLGVEGLEAWHPNHEPRDSRRLERLAESLGMIVTGGSDFHGEHLPRRKLGSTGDGRPIPDAFLEALETRVQQRQAGPRGQADSLRPAGG